jgi:hypothetical protein
MLHGGPCKEFTAVEFCEGYPYSRQIDLARLQPLECLQFVPGNLDL